MSKKVRLLKKLADDTALESTLRKAARYSFSARDILDLTNGKCNIFIYKELSDVHDINELFSNDYPCVLLYESVSKYGHWTALIRRNSFLLEQFDSYGADVDSQLMSVQDYYRNTDTFCPHLSCLIANSNYKTVITNKERLQRREPGINTCGRWVALRCITWTEYGWDLCKFINVFKGHDSDMKATLLTLDY